MNKYALATQETLAELCVQHEAKIKELEIVIELLEDSEAEAESSLMDIYEICNDWLGV